MPPLKYPRWALTLLATAQLIIALDATIIFVALHDMGRALQINAQQLQWVVSAYTVTFGGSLLLGGRAADLLGRRRFYRLGMLLFALASLLGALAPNATLLIVARAAQGIGAALLFPATLALIIPCMRKARCAIARWRSGAWPVRRAWRWARCWAAC